MTSYLSVGMMFVSVVGYLVIVGYKWCHEIFNRNQTKQKDSIIKSFFILIGMWLLLPFIRYTQLISEIDSYNIPILMSVMYSTVLFVNIIVTVYLFLMFTYNLFLYFGVDIVKSFKKM